MLLAERAPFVFRHPTGRAFCLGTEHARTAAENEKSWMLFLEKRNRIFGMYEV